ncbi:MAG: NifB/NifX family molybdenum-iron cluster-binding protein [Ancalomicrobiaceae bacterium]|nr:NifB/NifX family molybdenum-iron cluster-binding protein [Ancalomicrobiaceae bacterium]
MNTLIAIPSQAPGGLGAQLSMHFGHCDVFTLVTLEDGNVVGLSLLEAPDHAQGGCLAPVQLLGSRGVTALAAGGMGPRPLQGFLEAGIQPYFAGDCTDVADVVAAFAAGRLPAFVLDRACGGLDSGACCGEHDHEN